MDIFNILWQLGVIAAILVFGFKLGLASGLSDMSRKRFSILTLCYGLGVIIITYIASFYTEAIANAIYTYNSFFYIVMAAIMIVAGILTIREWKTHKRSTAKTTCLAVIAPCPCCFGSIVASILMVAPVVTLPVFHLSIIVAISLMAVMALTYFTSNKIIELTDTPYPIVLGNFMLFLGAYFLLSAIVIPAIAEALGENSKSITINSVETVIIAIVFIIILMLVGAFLNKKSILRGE